LNELANLFDSILSSAVELHVAMHSNEKLVKVLQKYHGFLMN